MGLFCLFTVFEICFLLSKQVEQEKQVWFLIFFFFLINIKNTKFKEEEFSENTFLVFFVLSKTVLKNNFKK